MSFVQVLRLLGASTCAQRDLIAVSDLPCLSRLLLGPTFLADPSATSAAAAGCAGLVARSTHSLTPPPHASPTPHAGGGAGTCGAPQQARVSPTLKRVPEGLMPRVWGVSRGAHSTRVARGPRRAGPGADARVPALERATARAAVRQGLLQRLG
jgi:hypothetical protein